jgi:hypothetical protein
MYSNVQPSDRDCGAVVTGASQLRHGRFLDAASRSRGAPIGAMREFG